MNITPEQCKAARAMVNWSQDQLEAESGVAKKSIADFERGAQIPFAKTLASLRMALEAAGISFIPENGGGAGVRLKDAVARLVRRRVSTFDSIAMLQVAYRGREYRVMLAAEILDDLDRGHSRNEAELEKSADSHRNLILVRAALAIDAGRADAAGNVHLTHADFPEA